MIKFRAWDKKEKEWLNIRTIGFDDDGSLWYLQAWDDNENDIDPPYFSDDLGVKWELIQSSGLKDLHDNEFFDKDIARDIDSEELGLVEYVNGAFVMKFTGGDSADLYDVKDNF
ncbi:YopX family protein, partial [Staphylococcus carnosus]|uniref:YopX family protein n=1 Tax=Staphylococcus carnosus TaxID=1281 RepID=UPI0006AB98AF